MQILDKPELPVRDLDWYKERYERLYEDSLSFSDKQAQWEKHLQLYKDEIDDLNTCLDEMKRLNDVLHHVITKRKDE